MCDRVALFNQRRIALSGSVTDLAQRVLGGGHVIDVEVRGAGDRERLAAMPGRGAGAGAGAANSIGSIASAICGPRSPAFSLRHSS